MIDDYGSLIIMHHDRCGAGSHSNFTYWSRPVGGYSLLSVSGWLRVSMSGDVFGSQQGET